MTKLHRKHNRYALDGYVNDAVLRYSVYQREFVYLLLGFGIKILVNEDLSLLIRISSLE